MTGAALCHFTRVLPLIRRRHKAQLPTIGHNNISRQPRARLGRKPEDAARYILGIARSAQRRHTSRILLWREIVSGFYNFCSHLGRIHYDSVSLSRPNSITYRKHSRPGAITLNRILYFVNAVESCFAICVTPALLAE